MIALLFILACALVDWDTIKTEYKQLKDSNNGNENHIR